MRLVLHIGSNKTGTGTLQATLSSHPELLGERGIVYPRLTSHPHNHTPLIALVKPFKAMPRSLRRRGDRDAIRRFGEECWEEILEQVGSSGAHTCILSSEYLFNPWGIHRLAAHLAAVFDRIDVIAYVRSPASKYPSSMQQSVKSGDPVIAPRDYVYGARRALVQHREVFGDRITVKPFEREQLVDGCIVADFLATMVPDLPGSALPVEHRNESISAEAMCVLQEHRDHLTRDAIRTLRSMRHGTRPRLRPDIAARLERQHSDELEWLHRHYGIAFAPPEESPPTVHDLPGWSSDRLREFLDVEPDRVERVRSAFLPGRER